MEIVSFQEFMYRTAGGIPNGMKMSIYEGKTFECACGDKHHFSVATVPVMRELPKWQLVFACPNGKAITCVSLKGLFKPRFESLFGTLDAQEE